MIHLIPINIYLYKNIASSASLHREQLIYLYDRYTDEFRVYETTTPHNLNCTLYFLLNVELPIHEFLDQCSDVIYFDQDLVFLSTNKEQTLEIVEDNQINNESLPSIYLIESYDNQSSVIIQSDDFVSHNMLNAEEIIRASVVLYFSNYLLAYRFQTVKSLRSYLRQIKIAIEKEDHKAWSKDELEYHIEAAFPIILQSLIDRSYLESYPLLERTIRIIDKLENLRSMYNISHVINKVNDKDLTPYTPSNFDLIKNNIKNIISDIKCDTDNYDYYIRLAKDIAKTVLNLSGETLRLDEKISIITSSIKKIKHSTESLDSRYQALANDIKLLLTKHLKPNVLTQITNEHFVLLALDHWLLNQSPNLVEPSERIIARDFLYILLSNKKGLKSLEKNIVFSEANLIFSASPTLYNEIMNDILGYKTILSPLKVLKDKRSKCCLVSDISVHELILSTNKDITSSQKTEGIDNIDQKTEEIDNIDQKTEINLNFDPQEDSKKVDNVDQQPNLWSQENYKGVDNIDQQNRTEQEFMKVLKLTPSLLKNYVKKQGLVDKIVEYLNEHNLTYVKELAKIRGVGEKTVQQINEAFERWAKG